jgi:Tat protein secretion system quality control protein TatD with DNase activity
MVETDAPDLFPPGGDAAGFADGKPLNHPANLPRILRALAEIRGVASPALCHETEMNARRFFGVA